MEQYRITLRLNSKEKEPHFGLGQVLAAQSRLTEARSELEEGLRSQPRDGEYHSEYAVVLERLGRKTKPALSTLSPFGLAPKSGPECITSYAMFLFRDGKLDQAIPEFEAALKYNPNHPEAHYHLGRALYVKGDYEGAKAHYLETARLDPKAPVHSGLGAAYFRLGQTSEAITRVQRSAAFKPG